MANDCPPVVLPGPWNHIYVDLYEGTNGSSGELHCERIEDIYESVFMKLEKLVRLSS